MAASFSSAPDLSRASSLGLEGAAGALTNLMTKIDRRLSRNQAASTLATLFDTGDVPAHDTALIQLVLEHDEAIKTLHAQNQSALAQRHPSRAGGGTGDRVTQYAAL